MCRLNWDKLNALDNTPYVDTILNRWNTQDKITNKYYLISSPSHLNLDVTKNLFHNRSSKGSQANVVFSSEETQSKKKKIF